MLGREHPQWVVPAASTIGDLLRRQGLSLPRSRRRRRQAGEGGRGVQAGAPNAVWCADFKGHFRTRDGARCDPLTISDGYSRYLIDCHIVTRLTTVAVRERFLRAFAEHGMPETIHTDNGVPFAGSGVAGLSRLAVEWVKAGITLERSRPGHPQDNGRHERMHRTLKAETASPPATDRVEQQRRFDRFSRRVQLRASPPSPGTADSGGALSAFRAPLARMAGGPLVRRRSPGAAGPA